jgi:ribonuclease D
MKPEIFIHQHDIPSQEFFKNSIAIDTEAMGLLPNRDRLCLVQICERGGDVHCIQIAKGQRSAPNLMHVLENDLIEKIFHFARFDVALLMHTFSVQVNNIYCTKIASKLCRTYTNYHGLKNLCRDMLGVELSKEQQTTDWGASVLSEEQKQYAANDVIYLHHLKEKLDVMLRREDRFDIAKECFRFLPIRAKIDLLAGSEFDIFSH